MELYSTEDPGIGGRIKVHFEDFVVQEISSDGTTLQLTDWDTPSKVDLGLDRKTRYTLFTVQKMGLSTMDVANLLAASLKISRNFITYAGLKDKRAVTVQTMSGPARIAEDLGLLRLSRVLITDIRRSRTPVHIGDLWGNRFTIMIREIEADSETSVDIAAKVRRSTLLNYFGVQRFGVTRPTTHLIGRALVKREFEDAIRIMVSTTSGYETPPMEKVREALADNLQPTDDMIDVFPRELGYERNVLKYLTRHPGRYEEAISRIPPRIQTLFVHAYQSYLFNKLISRRVKRGLSIVSPDVGDFIIRLDEAHSGRDSWSYTTDSTLDERREQVTRGKYGLAAPVVGYSTRMPQSTQTDFVKEILDEEGVRLMDFRNSKVRALDSQGGLRLVSMSVPDMEVSCEDGLVRLSFNLRKGSYATVVLRELMKNDPTNRV